MPNYDYIFRRTDDNNPEFVVKPYTANGPSSPAATSLYNNAGTAATTASTSLAFLGKGVVEYNVVQNNLLYLLENFSNPTRPLYPTQGQMWYKNADVTDPNYPSDPIKSGLYVWDTGWKLVPTSDITRAAMDMQGIIVTNLGTPVANSDAVTKAYADSKVALAGDTMTGFLTLNANPINAMHASPKQYTDTKVALAGDTMTGFLTLNANPINAMHASPKQYTDTKVALAGDTMTGFLTLNANPTNALHAVTKQYVDGMTLDSLSDTVILGPTTNDMLVYDGVSWVNAPGPSGAYVPIVGGTMTGSLVLSGLPTLPMHAVPKQYVDNLLVDDLADVIITAPSPNDVLTYNGSTWINAPTGSGGADGVVWAGSINTTTGALTLNRTAGLPNVTITNIAAFSHGHVASNVSLDMSSAYQMTTLLPFALDNGFYPMCPTSDAFRNVDQTITRLVSPVRRQLIVGDGATSAYTLRHNMVYTIGENRLQIFENGVKLYANERARAIISFNQIGVVPPFPTIGTLTGLAASTAYTFTITVNGVGPTTITITTPASPIPYTYYQLLLDIADELATLTIPAQVNLEQHLDYLDLVFDTDATGAGTTISVTAGTLFAAITTTTPVIRTPIAGATYGYAPVGLPGDDSNQITFTAPTILNAVYEVLIAP